MARTAECASCLNIPFDGRGVFSNSITIYFHADVARMMGAQAAERYVHQQPGLGGFFRIDKDCQSGFLVVNTVGDPSRSGSRAMPPQISARSD